MVMTLYCSLKDTTIVAFTDGSCQGNPEPCGSGAVLYPGDNEGISLKRPVAQRGSILLAELVAMLMVFHFIIVEVFTACLTSDMVMTLYCSFRDIDSFAASFASWSAISFPAILAWPGYYATVEKKKPLNTTYCTATFTIMREPNSQCN
jgi:hypothetical protein